MNSSSTVSAELGLRLVVPQQTVVPLVASLYYSKEDPYAIRIAFHVGLDEPVENIELSSPFGQAHFEAPIKEISDFLKRTYAIVPGGKETDFVNVEAEIADLLRQAQ
jgi:hypothetical protein